VGGRGWFEEVVESKADGKETWRGWCNVQLDCTLYLPTSSFLEIDEEEEDPRIN
jgi:hypothetical protein